MEIKEEGVYYIVRTTTTKILFKSFAPSPKEAISNVQKYKSAPERIYVNKIPETENYKEIKKITLK